MNTPYYTSAAVADLKEITEYISRDNRDAAARWLDSVEAKCSLIATQPNIGESALRFGVDVRMSFVGRYIIFHRHANNRTEILRIISGDRHVTKL